jgi:hypothetical protein
MPSITQNRMEVYWQENEICEIFIDIGRICNKVRKFNPKGELYISCTNQGISLEREKEHL